MGQIESVPSGLPQHAFHVLKVDKRSPAEASGIEPFFDYICGIGNVPIVQDLRVLSAQLEAHVDAPLALQVYSSKTHDIRDITVTPSRTWGADAPASSLLGLALRWCDPARALEDCWHILDVAEGSPADTAGLVPYSDWVLGFAEAPISGEGGFHNILERNLDQPLRFFVYNYDYDLTREVVIIPTHSWDGDGVLGCGIGYGVLHRIPNPKARPPVTLEESAGHQKQPHARLTSVNDYGV